jgi:hypothetical protein
MEKRCFRMGINKSKLYFLKKFTSSDFILIHGFWGYEKNKFNDILNAHILGLINNYTVFKSDLFLEHLNRCCVLCSDIIESKGNTVFLVPSMYNNDIINQGIKELVVYFCLRSLQPFCFSKRVNYRSIDYVNSKKSYVVIIPYIIKGILSLRRFLSNLIPFIYIEDSNFCFNRGAYFITGNNNSIYFVFFCYKILSYSILRSMFLSCCKNSMF